MTLKSKLTQIIQRCFKIKSWQKIFSFWQHFYCHSSSEEGSSPNTQGAHCWIKGGFQRFYSVIFTKVTFWTECTFNSISLCHTFPFTWVIFVWSIATLASNVCLLYPLSTFIEWRTYFNQWYTRHRKAPTVYWSRPPVPTQVLVF